MYAGFGRSSEISQLFRVTSGLVSPSLQNLQPLRAFRSCGRFVCAISNSVRANGASAGVKRPRQRSVRANRASVPTKRPRGPSVRSNGVSARTERPRQRNDNETSTPTKRPRQRSVRTNRASARNIYARQLTLFRSKIFFICIDILSTDALSLHSSLGEKLGSVGMPGGRTSWMGEKGLRGALEHLHLPQGRDASCTPQTQQRRDAQARAMLSPQIR